MSEFDDLGAPPGHTGQSPKRKATRTDVVVEKIEALADTPLESTGKPPSPEAIAKATGLVRASALLDPDYEENPEDLGFEPENKYMTFPIVGEERWPDVPRHQVFKQRFYVESPKGTIGMVPWPGSQVVWPWERAWTVDLYRETVTSFLKEEKKEKPRR